MSQYLWVIDGKGRCANARAYVLAESPAAAIARLTRDDACPFFDVKDVVTFVVGGTPQTGADRGSE